MSGMVDLVLGADNRIYYASFGSGIASGDLISRACSKSDRITVVSVCSVQQRVLDFLAERETVPLIGGVWKFRNVKNGE